MDTATIVLNQAVTKTPTEIQKEVSHLRELSDEKFISVQTQFKERDTRQERESRDNKVAVDAAFAAQKEAAAKQDEANAKAIDKSERATAETIKTNQELSKSTTDALTKSLDEVKLAIGRIEATKQGSDLTVGKIYAAIAAAAAIGALLSLFASKAIH
jgi:cation transport regulator ChaB